MSKENEVLLDPSWLVVPTQLEDVKLIFLDMGNGQIRAEIRSTCLGARRVVIWRDCSSDDVRRLVPTKISFVTESAGLRVGAALLRDLATQWEAESARLAAEGR